jgi:hypothetical protein
MILDSKPQVIPRNAAAGQIVNTPIMLKNHFLLREMRTLVFLSLVLSFYTFRLATLVRLASLVVTQP